MENEKKRRRYEIDWNSRYTTTFYPQYGEGRDKVTAVSAVRPTRFQQVIPRYNLSATETRDQGVGPVFEEVAYNHPMEPKHPTKIKKSPQRPAPKKKKVRKIRYDFSA